jgi:hypothetical protein
LRLRSGKPRLTVVGIRCADHVTPSTRKSRHHFADSGGRSVAIVRLRTKATEFVCCCCVSTVPIWESNLQLHWTTEFYLNSVYLRHPILVLQIWVNFFLALLLGKFRNMHWY